MTLQLADTDPEVFVREPAGAATRARNLPTDISPGRWNFEWVSIAWRDVATKHGETRNRETCNACAAETVSANFINKIMTAISN